MSRISPLFALTLLAALLAGCGEGGSSGSTEPTAGKAAAVETAAAGAAKEGQDREPAAVAAGPNAAKKNPSPRSLQTAGGNVREGGPKESGHGKQGAPDSIEAPLRKLLGDGDGGGQAVSSPRQIRKVINELKAAAGDNGGGPPTSAEKALEEVLGE